MPPQGEVQPVRPRPPKMDVNDSWKWTITAFFMGWIWGFTGQSEVKDLLLVLIGLLPATTIAVAMLSKTKATFKEIFEGATSAPTANLVLAIAFGLALGVTIGIFARNKNFLSENLKGSGMTMQEMPTFRKNTIHLL